VNRFSAPSVSVQSRIGPSFSNNRFGGGLSALFGFLPPRLQQVIANALGNAGPGGQALCRILGIPQCQNPDSTG
jgi:hypothetical protein